jgi:AcrR family transcriptional regulator
MTGPPAATVAPDRRAQLLAAADRVVQRDGSAASMNLIAAEAGITKPILYRHFGDKGGLYRALAERHIDQLLERLRAALGTRGGLRARTRATVDAYLTSVEEQPQVYRFLMERAAVEEPGVRGQVEGFVRRFGDELAAGIRAERELGPGSGSPVDERQALVWAHAIAGMVQATGDWWLDHPEVPRAAVVDELVTLLWDGFAGVAARGG